MKIGLPVALGLTTLLVLYGMKRHGYFTEQVASPPCPYQNEDSHSANAGCMLIQDNKVLMIAHKGSGKWDFPGGTANFGEAAQCVAYRETYEEAGLDVQVGELIQRFDNGYELYRCHHAPISEAQLAALSAKPNPETNGLELLKLEQISAESLRFPNEFELIQQQLALQPDKIKSK